ncbi:hypothetical protein DFH29DRAFT_997944 [Suillus ampliporus]|nr:hypothetical protein DFH29DRAFT_997944 [Suillus ampliporus]
MGRTKGLRVVLSDSLALSDYDSGIVTPLVEPQVDSPSGPQRTKRPNTGKGGTASQLRKVGEAVIDAPARRTGKGRQFVIPDGEPENIMAPSPVKKRTCKKGQKAAVPVVQTPDQSDGAGSTPTLHVAENGERFGFQKNPVPPGYIGLQPLGSEEHPVRLKSRIQRDRPHSHTHTEVATRPTVELPVMRAPAVRAGRALPDSASSILRPGSISENEETKHHSDNVYDELNMVDDDKFPPSNDEMRTSPPVKFSLDRHADENEDIGHTQRCQGQAERWVGHPGHASRKDYGQNRHEDPGERSQPQAGHLHGASKQARSNAIAEVPNVDYDVIKWHQKTNLSCSFSITDILAFSTQFWLHCQPAKNQSNNDRQVAGDSGDMKVDTDSEVQHTSVGRRTKAAKSIQDGAVVAKRKTLGFFLDLWVKLLNYTKACFRLHLAITDPFPAREEALSDTGICLELITESIVAWEAQNHRLEAGFYPQYEYDMATVIYNNSINFRSRIKQIAINVVPVEYKLSGSESEIKQKASALLKSSTFLRGERDEHDRTSNFVHSGLRSVCLQAFYDGGSKLLPQFPEFHNTIPHKALLLVATIVRNVIHVYSMYGHMNTKQTALGDSEKVYRKLMNMLKQVTNDKYHSEKLDDELRSWAVAGMTGVVVDGEPQGIESDSDWVVELN